MSVAGLLVVITVKTTGNVERNPLTRLGWRDRDTQTFSSGFPRRDTNSSSSVYITVWMMNSRVVCAIPIMASFLARKKTAAAVARIVSRRPAWASVVGGAKRCGARPECWRSLPRGGRRSGSGCSESPATRPSVSCSAGWALVCPA